MAGILNPKSRIMDLVMTQEGKRQLASGDFKVSYASFTDKGTFYDRSSISGSSDTAYNRPYFEAVSYPFDSITIESNDQGNVLSVGVGQIGTTSDRFAVKDGKIETKSSKTPVKNTADFDSKFSSYVDDIIKSTTQNFKKQQIIASRDPIDDSDQFLLSQTTFNLSYSNIGPIAGTDLVPLVDQAPSLLTHKRFANSLNFQYLPPIVESNDALVPMGSYPDIKESEEYTYADLISDLDGSDPENPTCPRQTIRFIETSKSNDICFQVYELGSSTLKKLDMVDFGSFFDAEDPDHPDKRVIFLGKVFVDSFGTPTYANIFTIILD